MRKSFFLVIYFIFHNASYALTSPFVEDKRLGLVCQKMLQDRDERLEIRQRLRDLLNRNKTLTKKTPVNKRTLKQKLKVHQMRVDRELKDTEKKLTKLEEKLIKKGCPGVLL